MHIYSLLAIFVIIYKKFPELHIKILQIIKKQIRKMYTYPYPQNRIKTYFINKT